MAMSLRTPNTGAFEMAAKAGAFDIEFLDRVTFSDRGLAREVLQMFDQQADSLLKVIRDTESTRMRLEIAHRLKGAARGVGAFAVGEAAAAAEPIDPALYKDRAIQVIETLRVEGEAVQAFIEEYLAA